MTGQQLIDYILRNKLQKAELDDHFVVVLKDNTWLDYDFDGDGSVTHYPDPNEDATWNCVYLTEEEALKLREEIGEMYE